MTTPLTLEEIDNLKTLRKRDLPMLDFVQLWDEWLDRLLAAARSSVEQAVVTTIEGVSSSLPNIGVCDSCEGSGWRPSMIRLTIEDCAQCGGSGRVAATIPKTEGEWREQAHFWEGRAADCAAEHAKLVEKVAWWEQEYRTAQDNAGKEVERLNEGLAEGLLANVVLRAENERLREALEEIDDSYAVPDIATVRRVARAALSKGN
jgi:hypothetical protein